MRDHFEKTLHVPHVDRTIIKLYAYDVNMDVPKIIDTCWNEWKEFHKEIKGYEKGICGTAVTLGIVTPHVGMINIGWSIQRFWVMWVAKPLPRRLARELWRGIGEI